MGKGASRPPGPERILTDREKLALRGAALRSLDLAGGDLSGADLRDAVLGWVELAGASLADADLRGAWFLACDLRRVDFRGARLGANRFDGSWLTGAIGLTPGARVRIAEAGGRFLLVHDAGTVADCHLPGRRSR